MSLESRLRRLEAAVMDEDMVWVTEGIRLPGHPRRGWVPKSLAEHPGRIVIPSHDPRYAEPCKVESQDNMI